MTFVTNIGGNCDGRNFVVTNPSAAGHKHLVTVLLTALATGSSVEVTFGGGCQTNANWMTTARIISQ